MKIQGQVSEGTQTKVTRALARGKLKKATNDAINWTTFDTRERMQKYLRRTIDRPTPFTMRGLIAKRSTQRRLLGRVLIRDEATKGTPPAKYLQNLQEGGPRQAKRSEKALRRAGHILPGQFIVPGPGARPNKYGNVTSGMYTKMLSGLGASSDPQQNSATSNGWFVMRKRGKRIAIARRLKTKTKIMFWIVDGAPQYEKQMRFKRTAGRISRKLFPARFDRALDRVLRRG